MLLVAKMVGQLGMHRTLYKSTRQLLQQALFADQVLRSLVIRKQLVDDSFVDSHTSLLVLRNLHLHKILNTLPRPIALITSMDEDGRLNAAPFSAYNYLCTDPPIIGVGVTNRPGEQFVPKDTARNIRRTGEFVVNVVT